MNNKELARRWFDEVWNQKNLNVMGEMLHSDCSGFLEGGVVKGADQFRQLAFAPLVAAFPDLVVTLENVIGEGDDVAVRWSVTATHTGPILGILASGRKVNFSGMTWLRFSEGKLIEGWDRWNLHGLLSLLESGTPTATASWV